MIEFREGVFFQGTARTSHRPAIPQGPGALRRGRTPIHNTADQTVEITRSSGDHGSMLCAITLLGGMGDGRG